jgi:hypothetical protein
MQVLLLLWGDEVAERAMSPAERRAVVERHAAFAERLRARGALRAGAALGASADGKLVRPAEGLVTDGPFAETKEQLGGLYLVDCADLQEAVGWALELPRSPGLVVEVRPLAG